MPEVLVDITSIEKAISLETRREIVDSLRATRTDIDGKRSRTEWRRNNIYFHSLQDTFFAARNARPNQYVVIRAMQACFVKDLDDYIERFPLTEDPEMKRLFQRVFDVGTSVFWDQDRQFTVAFDKAYWELNRQVIRPWVIQNQSLTPGD